MMRGRILYFSYKSRYDDSSISKGFFLNKAQIQASNTFVPKERPLNSGVDETIHCTPFSFNKEISSSVNVFVTMIL